MPGRTDPTLFFFTPNLGAGLSIVLGFGCWIAMEFIAPEVALPPQFAVLIAGAAGMGVGSVLVTTRRR